MVFSTRGSIARSNQAYYAQLAETESLPWGIAFYSRDYPDLGEANQFREVIVDRAEAMAEAFAGAEGYFQERGLQCRRWAPSVETDPAAMEPFLIERGFTKHTFLAMRLTAWPKTSGTPEVRVLPARAMRDAFSAAHVDRSLAAPDDPHRVAEAALQRLDNAALDMFVAVIDRKPVGRGGLFLVGDIGQIVDLAVLPEWRRQGVGLALLHHCLTIAHRLAPRVVCAEVPADSPAARRLFERCCFTADGELVEFHRPAADAKRL